MAQPIPVRTIQPVASASISKAVTPNGMSSQTTTNLTNSISGDKELAVTFANPTEADIANVSIFTGVWRTAAEKVIKTGVVYSSDGFTTYESLLNYFQVISTNISGMRIETDNVENFMSTLLFTEKDPSGKENQVKKLLSKFRVPVGSGFSETIELTESDLNIVKWSALEMVLSKLKANSEVNIYFTVRGWNKSQELSALQNDIL